MIKKMTKYSFVVFHKDVEDFLRNLQEIGVVDITRQKRAIDSYSMEKFEEIASYNAAVSALKRLKAEAQKKKLEIPSGKPESGNLLELYTESIAQKELLKNRISVLKSELEDARPWGAFTQENFRDLEKLGITPYFYCVSAQKYNREWEGLYPIHILGEYGNKVYFTVLSEDGSKPDIPVANCTFPTTSADILQKELLECEAIAANVENTLLTLVNCTDDLCKAKDELFNNLDLYLASGASQKKADETIIIFEAFAPTEIDSDVVQFLEENNVYYLKEEAKNEDNPPVKLKNNFFARLYEPIGELYMLPKYGELDLTMFYAPFYMLFFGFCLGDMGYGLVLILAGLFATFKLPKFANYGKLIAWLGLGTIIIPALGGTVFGAKIYELVKLPANITDMFFNDMQMFWFAILFGIFHIIFARMIHCVYNILHKNWNTGLNALGWAISIAWATLAYASSEAGFR